MLLWLVLNESITEDYKWYRETDESFLPIATWIAFKERSSSINDNSDPFVYVTRVRVFAFY